MSVKFIYKDDDRLMKIFSNKNELSFFLFVKFLKIFILLNRIDHIQKIGLIRVQKVKVIFFLKLYRG